MADTATVAAMKAKYRLSEAQYKALASAWTKGMDEANTRITKLDELRAKRASDFTKNAAGYVKARDSGTSAARVRAAVELARLKTLAPVEFAKAATLPDRNLQTTITQQLSAAGLAETPDKDVDKARKAWQMFLTTVQPSSANVLGSYEWMVNTYGDPNYLGVNDGPLRDKLAEVLQKREVEQKNAAEFDTSLEKLNTSWATWLRNHPNLDPEADSTFEIFQRDAPIDMSIIPGAGSVFMQNIEDVAKNPEAHPEFFSDIDESAFQAKSERDRYEHKLEGLSVLDIDGSPGGNEAQDESMRAVMAAWVRRPEVQWWAKENGFELGKAEPVDPESDFGKEVAAGRVPGQFLVNGMIYSARPDDLRAFRLASAQMHQDPEDNILRAVGLAHKTGPRRMIEVEEVVEPGKPVKLVKQGVYENGIVALDSAGGFHWSTDDGKTWNAVDKGAGQDMMVEAEAAESIIATPEVELPGVLGKPVTRTRQLEYREPVYGRDYPNSVRGVDPETGKEVYIPPEKVARQTFLGGEPSKGPTLVERINKVSADKTLKKSGFDLRQPETQSTELAGPPPTPKQKKATKTASEAMRSATPPDIDALPEARPESGEAPVEAPKFDRYAPRKGYIDTIKDKAKALLPGAPQPYTIGGGTPPKPPGEVLPGGEESAGTTTSTTTTPTASTVTDAQKKALEESRKRQKEAEMAQQTTRRPGSVAM